MLTVNTIPLRNFRFAIVSRITKIANRKSRIANFSLTFLVQRVAAAATAELLELKPVRSVFLVLGRHVIALFAFRAL
jgi:hypothetical protein